MSLAKVTVPQNGQLVTKPLTITPQLLLNALAAIVTEVVALGVFNNGFAQQILAVAGIVIPAVFSIAQALHLGPIHAALIARAQTPAPAPVAPVPAAKTARRAG